MSGMREEPTSYFDPVTRSNCQAVLTRRFLRSFSWPTEKGARNFAYAAICDDPSGSYISECQAKPVSEFVRSEKGKQVQQKVWNELKEIWVEVEPKVHEVLA